MNVIDLPSPDARMTPGRKLRVVNAIAAGQLTEAEALTRFNLSAEELAGWQVRARRFGTRGLCTTRTQELRP